MPTRRPTTWPSGGMSLPRISAAWPSGSSQFHPRGHPDDDPTPDHRARGRHPVLSDEQNRTLTEVGAGTRMGQLLRRYWMPIAAVAELEDTPVKAVRLLGEDLVLYRDKRGTFGLLDRHCAHRR